jgi:riboflavin kinase/FMN adenylyltransferase
MHPSFFLLYHREVENGISFTAQVITGAGLGKKLTVPTLNLDLPAVPSDLEEGVFAVRAVIDGTEYPAAMHYGPRPTLHLEKSCEVHLIDTVPQEGTDKVTVTVIGKLRDVQEFQNAEELKSQLLQDVTKAREMLG